MKSLRLAALVALIAPSIAFAQAAPIVRCDASGPVAVLADKSVFQFASVGDAPGHFMAIARLRPDGSADPRWAEGRPARLPENFRPLTLLALKSGGLLALDARTVVKLSPSGALDTSFGVNGVVSPMTPESSSRFLGAALQPNGSLVVALEVSVGSFVFVRYDRGGRKDLSFGSAGTFRVPLDASKNHLHSWSILPDGSAEVASHAYTTQGQPIPRVIRVTPGSLTPTILPAAQMARAGLATWSSSSAKVDPQGRLLLAASAFDINGSAIWRFLPDGQPDPQFGTAGRAVWKAPSSARGAFPDALWLVPGGGWTLVSKSEYLFSFGGPLYTQVDVARLTAAGTMDPTFAPLGIFANVQLSQLDVDGFLLAKNSEVGCQLDTIPDDQFRAEGTAIEYFHPGTGRYFMTLDGLEAAILDNTSPPDWQRTGYTFGAWTAVDLPGATKVCRFHGDAAGGPKGHFYTPEGPECEGLKALDRSTPQGAAAWRYEGLAFNVALPENGACPANLNPVYRAYNRGFESGGVPNHRHTTDETIYAQMQAQGWAPEGVRFCVPLPGSRTAGR